MDDCTAHALKLLAKRSHSIKELAGKLYKSGFAKASVAQTIDFLMENKWLDDAKFAENRARYRATQSRWGRNKIRQELQGLGVPSDLTAVALTQLEGLVDDDDAALQPEKGHDFQETATALLARKFGTWPEELRASPSADPILRHDWTKKRDNAKKKRLDFLLRRGFSMAEALHALTENQIDVGDDDETA
ncbi:MAG: regulatory protein RecX [Alphaproteobacteria bacterium]